MNRFLFIISCFFVVFIQVSCSGNDAEEKITVKGEDGTEYDSYQSACRNEDFMAAYKYLDAMQEKLEEKQREKGDFFFTTTGEKQEEAKKYEEQLKKAKTYVLKQEMLFLAAQNTEESTKRILFLLKNEDETEWELVSAIIDLAITQKNDELLKEITKQYVEYNYGPFDKVSKRLAELNDDQSTNIIIEKALMTYIPSHPTVGLHDYIETNYALEGINWYNKECRKILDIAINAGNKTLALKALSFFVQDMIIYEGGHDAKSPDGTWKRKAPNGMWIDGDHSYVAKYTNDSKNNAQKVYQEAVRSGAFNK